MKTLYFDCFAGASGNMMLGALADLGLDRGELVRALDKLSIPDLTVTFEKVDRSGISAVHVEVEVPEQKTHRHLHHIESMIDDADLSPLVKDRSKAVFQRLAAAEARVHGVDVQKVHFHEVGAVDAIVDVVGSCIGFEMLGVERFVCSKIHVGSGFVTMEHGKYPVPPPAVAKLLEGVPAYSTDIVGELLTPTGAAIITALCREFGPLPEMVVEGSGYGAGTREYDGFPNVLRLVIGDSGTAESKLEPNRDVVVEKLTLLETNIDDMSPQVVGYVLERALEIGALDCWATAAQMKKSRPGSLLSVLCRETERSALTDMLFSETTTLGIRTGVIERTSLHRELQAVETVFGPIEVKTAVYNGRTVNVMPEYEHVKRAAIEHGVPFHRVHSEAVAAFKGMTFSAVG